MKIALMEYQWICLMRISEPKSTIKKMIIDLYIKEKQQKSDKNEKCPKYDKLSEILEVLMAKDNIKSLIAYNSNKTTVAFMNIDQFYDDEALLPYPSF